MYFTYTLISEKDSNFYVGFTNDLVKRYKLHQEGKVNSTANRRPLKLVYYETCLNKYDALHREKFLKSGPGKKYLRNRLKYYLNKKSNGHEAS